MSIPGLEGYSLADPISLGSGTIVPVLRIDELPQKEFEFLSLTEAKKLSLIQIEELPEARVQQLMVRNLGDRPILLLAGELLLGGKQDRVVTKDTIVPPNRAIDVSVFCVEHGRWRGNSSHFEAAPSMVPNEVRKSASFGTQTDVWNDVENYNRKSGSRDSSVSAGLFTEEVQAKIGEQLPRALQALNKYRNAVGAVFILRGEIQSLDLFGSPVLFEKSSETLLRSWLAEVSVHDGDRTYENPNRNSLETFVASAVKGERSQTRQAPSNSDWDVRGRGVAGTESFAGAADAASTPDAKSFIHGSYVPK